MKPTDGNLYSNQDANLSKSDDHVDSYHNNNNNNNNNNDIHINFEINRRESHDKKSLNYVNLQSINSKSKQSSGSSINSIGNIELTNENYYCKPISDICIELNTSVENGLSESEINDRLNTYGKNVLEENNGPSAWSILLGQIFNAMVLVLVISMAISFGIRDWICGGVIAAVIGINIVVGFYQEYNAEKIMASLKSLSSPTAHVIRNGSDITIPSQDLCPGDLVSIKVGDTVPADLRIVTAMNLETDEALLTGESLPVCKDPDVVYDSFITVGDRLNMAYSSSVVTKGRATAIVVATGMNTEIGKIAASLNGKKKKFRSVPRNEEGNARIIDFPKTWTLSFWDLFAEFLGLNVGTPLHRKLARLAVYLFWVAVLFAIVVMAANKFHVTRDVAIYAIATALSMIPASLVVVLTITMAIGTKFMATRNVIVRKLDSLEALGSVNDICSDKTGTLTQGKMVLRKSWIPGVGTYSISGSTEPFNPTIGFISFTKNSPKFKSNTTSNLNEKSTEELVDLSQPLPEKVQYFLNSSSMANIANVHQDDNKVWKANGDPTEIAIQVAAHRFNWGRQRWTEGDNAKYTLMTEFPFDSSIKRMSAIYRNNKVKEGDSHLYEVFSKGAVERVFETCDYWYGNKNSSNSNIEKIPLTQDDKDEILSEMDALASEGLRVLAFASGEFKFNYSSWSEIPRGNVESSLTFLGLVGIYDPPREESAGAVLRCHHAGINVHMLTGDHPETAKAIAKEVNILPKNLSNYSKVVIDSMIMTAPQFDALSDDEVDALPVLPLVIARCAPQTKVRMIEALHRRGAFAAMTGDGVNDSPSLKKADVGIAMGLAGSDVAKSSSDIVLMDDNFASILNAIEEGRRMADNIQKFVLHLLAGNVAQALYLLVGLCFRDKDGYAVFPLSPVEVLWVIMVTSSLPAMGLGAEPAAPDLMDKPPKDSKVGVFSWEVVIDMMVYGFIMGTVCLVSFAVLVYGFGSGELGENCNNNYSEGCKLVFRARSATFVELTGQMLLLAWEVMDMRRSFFYMNPNTTRPFAEPFIAIWRNQFLFWSIIGGFATLFLSIYIPVINHAVFLHSAISWEWAVSFIGLGVFIICVEIYKFLKRCYFTRYKGDKARDPADDLEKIGHANTIERQFGFS